VKHDSAKLRATLRTVVRSYIANWRPISQAELVWYRDLESLDGAIECAALAMNSKRKRHPHQYRLKRAALEEARQLLLHSSRLISQTKNFEGIFALVGGLVRDIRGLGELYTYDTSLRIGAHRKLFPKAVYLHSGTREGARALGLDWNGKKLEVAAFPVELQALKPFEIEDVLCLYRDHFVGRSTLPMSRGCGQPRGCRS